MIGCSARGVYCALRKTRGFTMGMICGAVLAVAGTAVAEDPEGKTQLVQAMMRAVAELAIDTERNAIDIVALRERIDDLELDLEKVSEAKQ